MALSRRSLIAAVSGGLLCVAFIFYVAAQADPTWASAKFGNLKITIGLWSGGACTGSGCAKINAARAFLALATIANVIAAALLLFLAFQTYSDALWMVAAGAALITFIFGMIGWSIATNIFVGVGTSMGAAGALGLLGWLLGLVAVIGTFLMKQQSE